MNKLMLNNGEELIGSFKGKIPIWIIHGSILINGICIVGILIAFKDSNSQLLMIFLLSFILYSLFFSNYLLQAVTTKNIVTTIRIIQYNRKFFLLKKNSIEIMLKEITFVWNEGDQMIFTKMMNIPDEVKEIEDSDFFGRAIGENLSINFFPNIHYWDKRKELFDSLIDIIPCYIHPKLNWIYINTKYF